MPSRYVSIEDLDFSFTYYNLNVKVLNIVKVLPDKDWHVPEHTHACYKFNIILCGKGHITIEDTAIEVGPGDIYVTAPYVRHSKTSDITAPMSEYILECEIKDIKGTDLSSPILGMLSDIADTFKKAYPYILSDTINAASRFGEIFQEAQHKRPGFLIKIQALILSILLDIYRLIKESMKSRSIESSLVKKTLNKQRVERLISFIDSNYKFSITLEDASKILYLSSKQINRLMKKELGSTFYEYLINYRIMIAKRLLENSVLSVKNIAEESGFSSYNVMYQAFKRCGNSPPTEIRRSSRL